MEKQEAISKAKDWYDSTKEHAYVVDMGGTFEWYCEGYFQVGCEANIVWGTSWD